MIRKGCAQSHPERKCRDRSERLDYSLNYEIDFSSIITRDPSEDDTYEETNSYTDESDRKRYSAGVDESRKKVSASPVSPGGDPGVEPPPHVKADVLRIYEITQEFLAEADKDVRDAMIREIFEINMKHLWTIGGLNVNPDLFYQTFSNRIRNQVGFVHAYYHHVPSAWYFEE